MTIALPGSVEEVQAVVRWANDAGVAVVPSGGRTGLSGGAVAANGELVVSLERLNRVLGFDPVDRTLTVQEPPLAITKLPTVLVVDAAGRVRLRLEEPAESDYAALPAVIATLRAR